MRHYLEDTTLMNICMNSRMPIVGLASCLLLQMLSGLSRPVHGDAEALVKRLSELRAQRLALIEKHDPLTIIPRMRTTYANLNKSGASSSEPEVTALERELAILTQQYVKELSPQVVAELQSSARLIQEAKALLRSQAPNQIPPKADIFDTLLI